VQQGGIATVYILAIALQAGVFGWRKHKLVIQMLFTRYGQYRDARTRLRDSNIQGSFAFVVEGNKTKGIFSYSMHGAYQNLFTGILAKTEMQRLPLNGKHRTQ